MILPTEFRTLYLRRPHSSPTWYESMIGVADLSQQDGQQNAPKIDPKSGSLAETCASTNGLMWGAPRHKRELDETSGSAYASGRRSARSCLDASACSKVETVPAAISDMECEQMIIQNKEML